MKEFTTNQAVPPHPIALWVLKAMLLLLGISALVSGINMILDPTGRSIGFPEGALDKSPFPNYLIPGLLLTVSVGVLPLVTWYALWKKPGSVFLTRFNPIHRKHWAWAAALKSGLVLMIWIIVQMMMVPFFFLQPALLIWAAVIIGLCFIPGVQAYYELPATQGKEGS